MDKSMDKYQGTTLIHSTYTFNIYPGQYSYLLLGHLALYFQDFSEKEEKRVCANNGQLCL